MDTTVYYLEIQQIAASFSVSGVLALLFKKMGKESTVILRQNSRRLTKNERNKSKNRQKIA